MRQFENIDSLAKKKSWNKDYKLWFGISSWSSEHVIALQSAAIAAVIKLNPQTNITFCKLPVIL